LQKWLRLKKLQTNGPGNSFQGLINKRIRFPQVDTLLTEIYDSFNKAIKENKITGKSSAEEYYQQLDTKYPGNPYTLDAKSTLAVEYINFAQSKIDQYLTCSDIVSLKEKEENTEAANRMEKAIAMVREDDEDFANSLSGRMYLLKAGGNNPNPSISFQNAYAALAINPDGAYIQNKLALLHLENKRTDSALYYAEKAVKTAPKWSCAMNTLALVKTTTEQTNQNKPKPQQVKNPIRKNSFGIIMGSGTSQLKPTYNEEPNTSIIDVNASNIIKLDFGIFYQANIGKNIFVRPATIISMEGGKLVYTRKNISGLPNTEETLNLKNTTLCFSLPLIVKLSDKNTAPYISIGPSFNYIMNQNKNVSKRVPVKKSVITGDAGLGVDFPLGKSGLIISPEIKYTQGFNNLKEDARNEYTNTISSLKKRGFTFSIYLRR